MKAILIDTHEGQEYTKEIEVPQSYNREIRLDSRIAPIKLACKDTVECAFLLDKIQGSGKQIFEGGSERVVVYRFSHYVNKTQSNFSKPRVAPLR